MSVQGKELDAAAQACWDLLRQRRIGALVEPYMVECFSKLELVQQALPEAWFTALEQCTPAQAQAVAAGECQPWFPATLVEFVRQLQDLALPRQGGQPNNIVAAPLPIAKVLARGMKPKKVHEVSWLAGAIASVCQDRGIETVFDFGSGKGYLGQILVMACGLDVVGIEAQEALNEAANDRVGRIAAWATKRQDQGRTSEYLPGVQLKLDKSVDTITLNVQSAQDINDLPNVSNAMITGLHTCGDLHCNLLRIFAASEARALLSLGCCYHKLTTSLLPSGDFGSVDPLPAQEAVRESSRPKTHVALDPQSLGSEDGGTTPPYVFPMSRFYLDRGASISPHACEMACHAVETWVARPATDLCSHTNRALLQVVLTRHFPHVNATTIGVGRMRLKQHEKPSIGDSAADFIIFTRAVLQRLKLDGSVVSDTQLQAIHAEFAHLHTVVIGFSALRHLVAQVLESMILLDRALFLREQLPPASEVQLVPLFDGALSPRNIAILAVRDLSSVPTTSHADVPPSAATAIAETTTAAGPATSV